VLDLVFGQDMTVEEAALALGISTGSARVHYDRGKKRLRHLLGENQP
jgi:RNA polymerase sigma-70 factor (ECF subfamily)